MCLNWAGKTVIHKFLYPPSISRLGYSPEVRIFLHNCLRRMTNAHSLRHRGGKLAFVLFPPVVTNKGEGIRRLIEQHGLKAVIYLGDDVSETDAFRLLRGIRARGNCMTLCVGVLYADSPARLITSADVVVDGPACARAFFESLVHSRPDFA
jgi:trehalose 6-phosphate phosphatase